MRLSRVRLLSLALVPFLLGSAPEAPPEAPTEAPASEFHRGIEWRGAAGFFSLGTMTVVYPAGKGESVDLNRRSAEARARWLAAVYRNKVEVVADDQLTEEQKKGNLLVLGWNNRFFAPPGPARPYAHDGEGLTFMGLRENDPTLDLLVFHRNPLNWASYILFWSRIDPERDRYQVLPRVGSDWAIYRNFGTVRQGMFVPGRTWPPDRDKLAEADISKEVNVRPGGTAAYDSEHYHVVYDPSQFKPDEVRAIAEARENALVKAAASIGANPEGVRIQLFVYDSDKDKQAATGVPDPTHSVASLKEMHAVRAYALAPTAREEVHILARGAYGPSYLTSIRDGLALSVENTLRGENIEAHAGRLRAASRLPEIGDLLDEERFRALPKEIGAASAGAFMAWVRQTYGPDGVKKIYGLSGGAAAMAEALGTTTSALAASWGAWADARAAALRNQLDFEAAELDAQKRRAANDWVGMAAALRKALRSKPGDPQTTFNLASAQMRAGDLAGAEASMKDLLAAPLGPGDSRFRIFGHYQLGRVYDLTGRRREALAEYDAVLALPDEHGAHALAMERKASPATREQLE